VKRAFIGVFVLGVAGVAGAETPALTLPELVSTLRARNPSVAAAARRYEAARVRIRRARALDDPFVTVMAEDVPPRLTGGMPMVRFQATQMLPFPGKRDRMAAVAEREAAAVGTRVDTALLDVVSEGRRLFHQLVLNREAQRINREQRALVDMLVQMATARLASATGSHHDVLKMQTEATMLDDGLIMLQADRREMAAMLNALLDRPAETPVGEPQASWSPQRPLDHQRLVEQALERRPELREMVAMAGAERAMAAAARREYYPDVMIGALYDARMDGEDTLGAMVGLNVPIWIGSKQGLDVRGAELRANALDRERAAMAAMVRAEVERSLARVDASQKRLELLEAEFLPRAQQTFDAAIRAFPSGMMSALEMLDDLRAVETQRLARTAAAVERELALVDLERAVGELR
jgi:outer membrane protein, heavy metal efflux system